jgi:hypothetical protein
MLLIKLNYTACFLNSGRFVWEQWRTCCECGVIGEVARAGLGRRRYGKCIGLRAGCNAHRRGGPGYMRQVVTRRASSPPSPVRSVAQQNDNGNRSSSCFDVKGTRCDGMTKQAGSTRKPQVSTYLVCGVFHQRYCPSRLMVADEQRDRTPLPL